MILEITAVVELNKIRFEAKNEPSKRFLDSVLTDDGNDIKVMKHGLLITNMYPKDTSLEKSHFIEIGPKERLLLAEIQKFFQAGSWNESKRIIQYEDTPLGFNLFYGFSYIII